MWPKEGLQRPRTETHRAAPIGRALHVVGSKTLQFSFSTNRAKI